MNETTSLVQDGKRVTRNRYKEGPAGFLAQQAVRRMQDAGFPAKTAHVLRGPEIQKTLWLNDASELKPWYSPYQWGYAAAFSMEATRSPPDWVIALDAVLNIMAVEYDVPLSLYQEDHLPGFLLTSWWEERDILFSSPDFPDYCRMPSQDYLDALFAAHLPKVWRIFSAK